MKILTTTETNQLIHGGLCSVLAEWKGRRLKEVISFGSSIIEIHKINANFNKGTLFTFSTHCFEMHTYHYKMSELSFEMKEHFDAFRESHDGAPFPTIIYGVSSNNPSNLVITLAHPVDNKNGHVCQDFTFDLNQKEDSWPLFYHYLKCSGGKFDLITFLTSFSDEAKDKN